MVLFPLVKQKRAEADHSVHQPKKLHKRKLSLDCVPLYKSGRKTFFF